jgi:hypothetical protein
MGHLIETVFGDDRADRDGLEQDIEARVSGHCSPPGCFQFYRVVHGLGLSSSTPPIRPAD